MSKNISYYRKHVIPILFITVIVSLVYANSLKGSFQFDDSQILLRTNLHLSELTLDSLIGSLYFTPDRENLYRPVPCLTLALNYYFGKDDTFGYHMVNIVIHILCSIAVYIFLLKLLLIPGMRPAIAGRYHHQIACMAAFLFALHPIQTNVATYIIQRMTSLAALFYLISFIGYIQFRMGTLRGQRNQTVKKTYASLFICLLSGLLAVLSKENAAILPVLVISADFLLFYPLLDPAAKKTTRKIYFIILLLLSCALAYVGPKYIYQWIEVYQTRDFTLFERLLTESRIIFFYIYLLLIPNVDLLNLNHDFSISTGLISPPQTLISIVGIILLVGLAFRYRCKKNLISFAIVWYLGNLVIESTFIPLELIFEHRTYLPGVMVFCMVTLAIISIGNKTRLKWAFVFMSILLVLYGNGTVLRNLHFGSEFALWLDAATKSPKSARARVYLGNAYAEIGELEKGKAEFQAALKQNPNMSEALLNLAWYYEKKKDYDTAELYYKRVIIQNTKPKLLCNAFSNLAGIYAAKNDFKKAEHFYQAALTRLYFYLPAIHNLGITKIHQGEIKAAESIFKHGLLIDSGYQDFYFSLAKLYANQDRYSEAINLLSQYLVKDKGSRRATILLDHIKKLSKKANTKTNEFD